MGGMTDENRQLPHLDCHWRNFHFRRHGAPQLPEPADRRRGDHGNGRRGPAPSPAPSARLAAPPDDPAEGPARPRRGPGRRNPPPRASCLTRVPPPTKATATSPGELTMRAAAGETIPDLPAYDRTTRPETAGAHHSPPAPPTAVAQPSHPGPHSST